MLDCGKQCVVARERLVMMPLILTVIRLFGIDVPSFAAGELTRSVTPMYHRAIVPGILESRATDLDVGVFWAAGRSMSRYRKR